MKLPKKYIDVHSEILAQASASILLLCAEDLDLIQKPTDCISRSKVPLRNFQKAAIRFISDPDQKSLLVVHATGSGKTLTALAATQCYLDTHPDGKVLVISPAGVVQNFEKEMKKYGGRLSSKYSFKSFASFNSLNKEGKYSCEDTMVVVDEAHNMRNSGTQYESVFKCITQADKVLLLTATPFVNTLHDFVPLINMLYQDDDILEKRYWKIPKAIKNEDGYFKALTNIGNALRNKVTYLNEKKSKDFPSVATHRIDIDMTEDYFKKYQKALLVDREFGDNPDTFYNGYRRAVNKVGAGDYVN